MDLSRLSSLVAVPLASLFLIVVLCVFAVQRPPSVGFIMPLTKIRIVSGFNCGVLDRTIFVRLVKDGSYWINDTPVSADELRPRLAEIYKNVAEKSVYMVSDPTVSYEEFANFYSRAASSDTDLRIVLLTRQIQERSDQCPLGSCCELEWPDHSKAPNVLIPIPPRPITGRPVVSLIRKN